MASQPRWRMDLVASGLLLAGLLVALSVFSHDAADQPGASVYPAHTSPANVLGYPGAWLGGSLQEALGLAVYLLLASWFVLVLWLFLRRGLLTWTLRFAGWLLLVPCFAIALDHLGSLALLPPIVYSPQAPFLPGGTLGAWLTGWLRQGFYPTGQILIVGSSSLLGMVLAVDIAMLHLARGTWSASRPILAWLWRAACWLQNVESPSDHRVADVQREPEPEFAEVTVAPVESVAESNGIPIFHHDHGASAAAEHAETAVRKAIAGDASRFADFELPALSLLEDSQPFAYQEHDQRLREQATLLEKTFTDFGLTVRVVGINTGPVITQYELALETGLRVHKVTALADDIALSLRAPSIRIVAPIPGKNTVGVEVPNQQRAVVRLKEIILQASQNKIPGGRNLARTRLPLFLGKDTEGKPLVHDLAEMPHLLIAGTTGTGKSVCMNAIILSLLMTRRPDEVKMIMIDPKMLEMSEYSKIPHLMHPVVKDMKKAEAILSWAVDKMEERYDILSRARVRGIAGYNELPPGEAVRRVAPEEDERHLVPDRMPYIVIFIDEMADLMLTMKKEVEGHIIRLAQKSRAAGIHLVVATQKPTVDVITGLIKSNLPARVCFQVRSRTDSRVVLDEMGADKLLGKGDMLFLQPDTSTLIRAQGAYASNEEIKKVIDYLECEPSYAPELIQLSTAGKDGKGNLLENLRARDDMYEPAIEIVLREGRGSVSLLQRALGIGYGRAARLVDFMAEDGIVGEYNGSQAREVLYTPEQWEQFKQEGRKAS